MADEGTSSDVEFVTEVEHILSDLGGRHTIPTLGELAARFGKYDVDRVLHCHGQAVVLLARDPDLDRPVILKLYHAAENNAHRVRLINEGRALGRIQSPYVATVFAVEEHEDFVFLVIEYVRGQSLRELLKDGLPTPAESLGIVRQVARGLKHVHELNLLHRDLKPANVMLTNDGQIRLIDFGLVSTLDSTVGDASGTPAYMAPERVAGDAHVDEHSDIFGVGAILYELLTGKPPFAAESNEESRRLADQGEVRPLQEVASHVPTGIASLCMRCLAANVDDRPANALELIESVTQEIANSVGTSATGSQSATDSSQIGAARGGGPWWAVKTIGAISLFVLVAAVGFFLNQQTTTNRAGIGVGSEPTDVADDGTGGSANTDTLSEPTNQFSLDGAEIWRLTNQEFGHPDRAMTERTSRHITLVPPLGERSQWIVQSKTDGWTLQNVATKGFLTSSDWSVTTVEVPVSESLWQVVEHSDGSVSVRNVVSGRFLDGDGVGDDWTVDESEEMKRDDRWTVTRLPRDQ